MNNKLTATLIALIGAASIALAADAPDTAYYPESSGQPDPKDMKGMTHLTPPPPPEQTHFYVAAYGGAQFVTSYGDNLQATNPRPDLGGKNTTNTTIHSNYGGVGGVKFGYMFDAAPLCDWAGLQIQPAVEADALYIGDNSHATDFDGNGSQEKFSSNSGDFFINGIVRFPNRSIVTPYFGAGVGLQYITTHGTVWGPNNQMATGIDTSDLDFAAQALAGFEFRLCDHISLLTEYKFIDALGTDAKSTNLPASNTYRLHPDQLQQHLITAGVKYDF